MKRCRQKFIAVTAILLASTLPVQALECLPDPEPACVFQQALLQADVAPTPERQVLGYLTVAYFQRTSDRGDPQSTLALLGSKLQQRNLTPEEMDNVFAGGLIGYAFLSGWGPHDPDAQLWVGCAAVAMINQINPTQASEEPPDCNTAAKAETAAMSAMVAAASPDPIGKFARLTAAGIETDDRDYDLILSSTGMLSKLQAEQLTLLVRKFAFREAEDLVASWPEQADRAGGYSYLAVHLARAGEIRSALGILTEKPELRDVEDLPDGRIRRIAETWARAGRADQAQELMGRTGRDYFDSLPRFGAIAASVAGDFDQAANHLQAIKDPEDRNRAASYTMGAYLTSGQTSSEDFLAALSPDLRPSAILGIGIHQAQTGDLEGALATLERLKAMGATDLPFELRAEIAPLLAAMGRADEAVMMAEEVGQILITAEVARQIK